MAEKMKIALGVAVGTLFREDPRLSSDIDTVLALLGLSMHQRTHTIAASALKKIHSTLSYAFIMSSFTAHSGFFLFLVLIACIHSYATSTLSMIILPGTKALCSSEIRTGRFCFSLFDNTFATILYSSRYCYFYFGFLAVLLRFFACFIFFYFILFSLFLVYFFSSFNR